MLKYQRLDYQRWIEKLKSPYLFNSVLHRVICIHIWEMYLGEWEKGVKVNYKKSKNSQGGSQ